MPRTRRSNVAARTGAHTNGVVNENVTVVNDPNPTSRSTEYGVIHKNNLEVSDTRTHATRGKRTFTSDDTPTVPSEKQMVPATPATQTIRENPAKRARALGPSHARPMPLQLPNDSEIVGAPVSESVVMKGKQVRLERTSSYYPNRGDYAHSLATLDPDNPSNDFNTDDNSIENEDDWMEAEYVVGTTPKMSARTYEAMETERASWQGLDTTSSETTKTRWANASAIDLSGTPSRRSSVSTPYSTPRPTANVLDADPVGRISGRGSAGSTPRLILFSEPKSGGHATDVMATAPMAESEVQDGSGTKWPSNTDLVFSDGSSTKLNLTDQKPLVHTIVQDAIENLRASLMFHHAFPDVMLTFSFSKESLITAAEKHKPGAAALHSRLLEDEDYLVKITQLPRARISLMRAEVKERCNTVTMAAIMAIESPNKIVDLVDKQLSDYVYTFPTAAKSGPLAGLARRTRPYRNPRIIAVIRDTFFMENGRTPSFASRFNHLFPVHQDNEGFSKREVPVPMVALVATALYATLYEWRTGKQQATGFSANKYLDVYRGHIDTFKLIEAQRPSAFHVMMGDIYTQASATQEDNSTGVAIANIDLNSLEG